MAMTKAERDALPASSFAVPGKRDLPLTDEVHTRLAWDMVTRTGGLTSAEQAEARSRILSRAKELGMDTSDWTKKVIAFQAMSLAMPHVEGHPNKIPFSGVLTHVDRPSDGSPGGADGKRVILPKHVAEAGLPSLLGMAVDMTFGLNGHDPQNKIGIITEANIVGDDIEVTGFFYGADFPDEVAAIQKDITKLGFSYEAACTVSDEPTGMLTVTNCIFTGAAVLDKTKAAYKTTSISAQDKTMDLTQIAAAVAALTETVNKLAANQEAAQIQAASIHDRISKHTKALRDVADGMEKDDVGMHEGRGHVTHLRKMADAMDADAATGKVPHIYNDHDWFANSAAKVNPEDLAKQITASVLETLKKEKTETPAAATTTTVIAASDPAEPARKTADAGAIQFMAKLGLEAPSEGGKLELAAVDSALKAAGVSGVDAMTAKLRLRQQGQL